MSPAQNALFGHPPIIDKGDDGLILLDKLEPVIYLLGHLVTQRVVGQVYHAPGAGRDNYAAFVSLIPSILLSAIFFEMS